MRCVYGARSCYFPPPGKAGINLPTLNGEPRPTCRAPLWENEPSISGLRVRQAKLTTTLLRHFTLQYGDQIFYQWLPK